MREFLPLFVLSILWGLTTAGLSADSFETVSRAWTAAELFEDCTTEGLVLSKDKSALEIARGTVVEDDGPAAGYSYQPNLETLKADKRLRKMLVVKRLPAQHATLLVTGGGDLEFQLNGKPLVITRQKQLGPYWQGYEFDPGLLRAGKNEIIVSGRGKIWIAREDEYAPGSIARKHHPNRSAKSTDGGKTWNSDRLGDKNNVDGEYGIRLALDQTQPRGTLATGVLDAGNLLEKPVGEVIASGGQVNFQCDLTANSPEACRLQVRSGSRAVPDPDWTKWSDVSLAKNQTATLPDLKGRYFQLKCTLRSANPLHSPKLRGLRVDASPESAADWTSRLKVVKVDNPRINRGSIDFQHENSAHPRLQKLRRDHQLDQLVTDAKSEFEVITRLAGWSSARWPKLGHLGEIYPPWDALEILKEHSDGTPIGGFCHQYNIVFLQACQSLGIPGRVVSIGPNVLTNRIRSGHEVVEVWSNEYQKWVYVDGNMAWYFTDPLTNIPLSLWEMRQAQLDAFEQKKSASPPKLVKIAETRYEWKGLEGFPAFLELRLVPRSNFLSQAAPLPLNQGMRGWFWTGYQVWSDDRLPAREIYPQKVFKRGNFECPMNCLHFTLEPLDKPGLFHVHVDVEMPNLNTVTAQIDDQHARPTKTQFDWQLHPGKNQLQLTPINQSNRSGRSNRIEFEFQ